METPLVRDTLEAAAAPATNGATNGAAPPAAPPRLLLLVRHGESTFNVEGRLPGQLPDIALTEEGRRQAHRAAVALSGLPLSAVVTSPLQRARETAEFIARGWGLPLHEEPRLMDTDVGPWAGKTISELARTDPAWPAFVRTPTEPPPGVEGMADVQRRAVAVAEEIRFRQEYGPAVVLVAHADVIKVILAHYLGIDVNCITSIAIANASISALAFDSNPAPHVLAVNWTAVPRWLVAPPKVPVETPGSSPAEAATASDAITIV